MLFELRIWIRVFELGYSNASNSFLVREQIEIQKCSELNSRRPKLTSKSGQNDPGTLIIGFALKNYAPKWSQIVKTLDG